MSSESASKEKTMPAAIMFYAIAFMYFTFGMSGMGEWNYLVALMWFVSASIMASSD